MAHVKRQQESLFGQETGPLNNVVNVATIPFRSPFRYPGGKTWLVPQIRKWLSFRGQLTEHLIEPFAGGAIVGLTAAFEHLSPRVTLIELDGDIASVWQTVINGNASKLAAQIQDFELTAANVKQAIARSNDSLESRAFATIVRNRVSRGGILAPGAGVVRNGENGRGLLSRWYPETIKRRILDIEAIRDRLEFYREDGIGVIERHAENPNTTFFIDPPYTIAGRRLYSCSELDHERLFVTASKLKGDFLMTYDDSPEICHLAHKYDLDVRRIPMKTTHHSLKYELLIGRDFGWFTG